MPSGLFALLDDVATIAKVAAASIDDVSAAASKAGVKAAGVVVDDTAVTPRYVTGFTPDRELPIIWRITKGSLFNKLVLILPVLLLLSTFAQWAITPLLMLGGTYLCFEGAEKVIHSLQKDKTTLEEDAAIVADKAHEESMAKGAIRTDFILSAEIMVIALNEVLDEPLGMRAATLAVVAVAITIAVYGVVGLIVKMDDIGLAMTQRASAASRSVGRGLVTMMPKLLAALATIGTAAMLWVGGQIVLHGLDHFRIGGLGHALHDFAHRVAGGLPGAGVWEWLIGAAGAGLFGLLLGGVIAGLLHLVPGRKAAAAH
jgi:predicted DNA repair protein MutK